MHLIKSGAFLILSKTINIFNNSLWEKQTFSQNRLLLKIDICYRYIARLFVSIAHAHAQKRCARTRT